jgi:hypothetical protein
MERFAAALEAESTRLGVSSVEARAATEAVKAFKEALADVNLLRTSVNVVLKDEARREAEAVVRPLAMRVKQNRSLTPADLDGLGLRKPATGRGARIGPPTTEPVFLCAQPVGGGHLLRYHDAGTPDSRALPRTASQLMLYAAFAPRGEATPTDDPSSAELLRGYTRTPVRTQLPLDARGRMVTYYARWQGKHGEPGPWSRPIHAWAA